MKGRMLISAAMSTLGIVFLGAALFASTAAGGTQASAKQGATKGGSLTIVNTSDFDFVDPQLSYFSQTWEMMAATQLTLLYYPHVEGVKGTILQPYASQGFPKVSKNGTVYTFTIKKGFKFNDGTPVTAANFKRAFDRGLNKGMQSPASSFMDDVKTFTAKGQTFTVTLKKPAPDFLSRMSMMFFAAVPVNLPINSSGVNASTLKSAGPYYLKEWNPESSALIVRNPHWKNSAEPFKSAGFAVNLDQVRWQVVPSQATHQLMCEKGEADICSFPAANAKALADKYGINKSQFHVKKSTTLWYVNMNTDQPLFKDNVKLRQSVNHAIDRRFMVAQHGYLAGARTDQILPGPMPGFKNFDIYSLKGPSIAKAKALATGNTRGGKAVMYTFNTGRGPALAQSVQFNLKQIGVDVEIKMFDRVVQHEKSGTRGEPFDMTIEGWGMDYPDPSNFINVLLDGRRLQAAHNVNTSYFNDAAYNKKMDAANALAGQARLTAYGLLDRDLMKNAAPFAPYIFTNARAETGRRGP
jgi:peptide/nickel transport system substrate-binding protein